MARIALYLSDIEMKWIAKQAGDVPLSKWCRKRLLNGSTLPAETEVMPNGPEQAETCRRELHADAHRARVVAGGAPSLPKKKTSACVHGKAKGDHCWQCGGLAVATNG
jgi:hypothetical protein